MFSTLNISAPSIKPFRLSSVDEQQIKANKARVRTWLKEEGYLKETITNTSHYFALKCAFTNIEPEILFYVYTPKHKPEVLTLTTHPRIIELPQDLDENFINNFSLVEQTFDCMTDHRDKDGNPQKSIEGAYTMSLVTNVYYDGSSKNSVMAAIRELQRALISQDILLRQKNIRPKASDLTVHQLTASILRNLQKKNKIINPLFLFFLYAY